MMRIPRPDTNLDARDSLAVAVTGLRTRRLRAVLSAVGIAIGVASVVAVLGLSASSKADLVAALDRLGTNLLQVAPGQALLGESASLPPTAPAMLRRLPATHGVTALEQLDAAVSKNDLATDDLNGIELLAAEPTLLATLDGRLAAGTFLAPALAAYPVVVLGAVAAYRLGITHWHAGVQVSIAGRLLTVVGVIAPLPLEPDLDRAGFVGFPYARHALRATGSATTIYVRVSPDQSAAIVPFVAAAANPEHPENTLITRPSDALAARKAAKSAFTSLFLGLGAVALLVGGIGIANVMVVAVLERRSEIGLRRALGATRADIRHQFLVESMLLAACGALLGVLFGIAATYVLAWLRGWSVVVPLSAPVGGFVAALLIGGLAGLYPATRASRLSPTEALRGA